MSAMIDPETIACLESREVGALWASSHLVLSTYARYRAPDGWMA